MFLLLKLHYINFMFLVRRLSDENEYLCTIQDDRTPYISCMCVVSNGRDGEEGVTDRTDCIRVVTGGDELHIIDIHKTKNIKSNRSVIFYANNSYMYSSGQLGF